ncbi:hypothetical protein LO762_31675 [Actinocorallia sp. API 0066]|uniref:hypothetical protein n=1 Tax=Actinocorallia sp. API 0066 TaxID=2896846 RepID=UPI001E2A333A|nr:hypothetical protein [Actinocorallia sp. API 0066]MCD0453712.1 hypothetical protein [Actinocorallia sp. API 0066]
MSTSALYSQASLSGQLCVGLHVTPPSEDVAELEWMPWPGGRARVYEATCGRCPTGPGVSLMYEWVMAGGCYRVLRHAAKNVKMYPSGLSPRRTDAREAWSRLLLGLAR